MDTEISSYIHMAVNQWELFTHTLALENIEIAYSRDVGGFFVAKQEDEG